MKIYYGERGSGKTLKTIQLSIEKQMPIICWSYEHKKYIEHEAYKLGVQRKLPEPILVREVRQKIIGSRKGLIIDDLDTLLRIILNDNIYYATMEDCDITHIEENDNYE